MPNLPLNENQAALLLEEDEDGEISVKVVQNNKADQVNIPAELCQVIARKLTDDEQFRAIILFGLNEMEEA